MTVYRVAWKDDPSESLMVDVVSWRYQPGWIHFLDDAGELLHSINLEEVASIDPVRPLAAVRSPA